MKTVTNKVTHIVCAADIHYAGEKDGGEKLRHGLEVLSGLFPGYEAFCVAGDLTDNGFEFEYRQAMSVFGKGLPEGAVFQAAMGNHEWYRHGWGVEILKNPGFTGMYQQLFTDCTGCLVEDERRVGNTVLLSVSPDDESDEISMREPFLIDRISAAEAGGADAVILSVHKAIRKTVSSSWDYESDSGDFLSQKWSDGFLDFLSHCRRVIYVSGHTHDNLRDNPAFFMKDGLVCVQTGFFGGSPSECIVIEVSEKGSRLFTVDLDAENAVCVTQLLPASERDLK